eukprot:TRINITY_DN3545_c0_g1_i10.p1 TRINITY_DN3545_c0_g1~~TRINITY_DN3545_c0_g1_i10.p1  ORF type:complete len:210 (-),score=19.00 TRINITY_DN3545_c0_g1_i10:133-762(-)
MGIYQNQEVIIYQKEQMRKLSILILIILVSGTAFGDIITGCSESQIVGTWKLFRGQQTPVQEPEFQQKINCGHASFQHTIEHTLVLRSDHTFTVIDDSSLYGLWKMVYDTGFELTFLSHEYGGFQNKHYTQFNYFPNLGQKGGWINNCSSTQIGWFNTFLNFNTYVGCFRAEKIDISEQKENSEQVIEADSIVSSESQPKELENFLSDE